MSPEKIEVKVSFKPEEDAILARAGGKPPISLKLSDQSIAPLELALISLGACAALDAYKLLSIRGGLVDEISVDVVMERSGGGAARAVELRFAIRADRVGRREAEEVITRSIEKYCSVGELFREALELDVKVRLLKKRRPSPSASSP